MRLHVTCMALATLAPMAFGAHEFMLYDAFPDNVISVRDIDFNIDMMGTLVKAPRGTHYKSLDVPGCPQCPLFEWDGRYGYVYINTLNRGFPSDGMNEKGLSVSTILSPPPAFLASADDERDFTDQRHFLSLSDIGHYLLSTCTTVDEAKQALEKFRVGRPEADLELMSGPLPGHLAVTDRAGSTAVIDWASDPLLSPNCMGNSTVGPDGALCWYDNSKWRVLVDTMSFEQQQTLLAQTFTGTFEDPDDKTWQDYFARMPGDWSPSSRLQRIVALNRLSYDASGAWVTPSVNNPMPATLSAFTFSFEQLDVQPAFTACLSAAAATSGGEVAFDAFQAELQRQLQIKGLKEGANATEILEGVLEDTGASKKTFGDLVKDISHMDPAVAAHIVTFPQTFANQDMSMDAVNRAMYIQGSVQLPPGSTAKSGAFGATQAVVIRDHTNLNYYYSTPGSVGLTMVDLVYLDFLKSADPLPLEVNQRTAYTDITNLVNNPSLANPSEDVEVAAPTCPSVSSYGTTAIIVTVLLGVTTLVGTGAGIFMGFKRGKSVAAQKLGYDSSAIY